MSNPHDITEMLLKVTINALTLAPGLSVRHFPLGFPYRLLHASTSSLGTDHLTCRGGFMVFCFVQNFFSDNARVSIFFFCRAKHNIFFQNLSLGYMTKL